MGEWKATIDISEEHEAFENGDMTIEQVAKTVAEKLGETAFKEDLADLIVALGDCHDVEDYDDILNEVYDFADMNKLWVRTL